VKETADLIIYNISELVTMAQPHGRSHVGEEMRDLSIILNGAVAIKGGKVAAIGHLEEVLSNIDRDPEMRLLDARGGLVTPGLVDAHTHLVFAGSREDEFIMRVVEGLSYDEIAQRGGGIRVTVAHTRSASADQLLRQARRVVSQMFSHGATTIEAKSGYALETEGEIKLLEVIQALNVEGPATLVPTLLGTHIIPPEFAGKADQFLKIAIEEMIPAVAKRGLARFFDTGTRAFTLDQTEALLMAAKVHGLDVKVHADEFGPTGGAELAAKLGATSAEHCIYSTDTGIEAMAVRGVIAVVLPAVPIALRLPLAPDARRFIDHGMAVALGTDFNPSCLAESMQLVMALACYTTNMSPAEALTAATINSAYAIGCGDKIGSLEVGKQADLVVWKVSNHKQLLSQLGGNLAAMVVKAGRVVMVKEE
jgi:imidazolonepropionase